MNFSELELDSKIDIRLLPNIESAKLIIRTNYGFFTTCKDYEVFANLVHVSFKMNSDQWNLLLDIFENKNK